MKTDRAAAIGDLSTQMRPTVLAGRLHVGWTSLVRDLIIMAHAKPERVRAGCSSRKRAVPTTSHHRQEVHTLSGTPGCP